MWHGLIKKVVRKLRRKNFCCSGVGPHLGLRRYWPSRSIGVARILSGGALFFAKKVEDLFLVVAFKTDAKTTYITSHTVQMSPISSKTELLLYLGGALTAWAGELTSFTCKFGPNFFLRPGGGVHVHPVHSWLRICHEALYTVTKKSSSEKLMLIC